MDCWFSDMYRHGDGIWTYVFVALLYPSAVAGNAFSGSPYVAGGTIAKPNPSLSVARHAIEMDGMVLGKDPRFSHAGRYVSWSCPKTPARARRVPRPATRA